MNKLHGKVAVVTGGGSGVGKDVARLFLAEGASVVISGRDGKKLAAVVKELGSVANLHSLACDVSDAQQCQALIENATAKCGRVDPVVRSRDGPASKPLPLKSLQRLRFKGRLAFLHRCRSCSQSSRPAGVR